MIKLWNILMDCFEVTPCLGVEPKKICVDCLNILWLKSSHLQIVPPMKWYIEASMFWYWEQKSDKLSADKLENVITSPLLFQ